MVRKLANTLRRTNPGRSIMTHLGPCLTILFASAALPALEPAPRGFAPGGQDKKDAKFPGRAPSYGGGPVQSANAVQYDPDALKAHNVPDLTTDNKNTLVLKYPGKLLLSASSIWDGWPEALAFDTNPYSS